MKRALPGGLELDDDPGRVDIDALHAFLSEHAYWALGRPRETVERLVREASRIVGLYEGDRLIGFARTVSDGQSFAYLADVYVLPEYRGRGLGFELVREAVENGPYADRRWLLHTEDAHALYEKLGFRKPGYKLMEREPP
ncbi:MAG TPA: GNAT family N-acetyltransferase [Gaiellaceae bacterium]|nr:GNAT family N-acetyltransferase [Gaiellaceae bacterium]